MTTPSDALAPVRVGIIGIGFGQHVHVPAFRRVPGCEVAGICANRLDRAREVAAALAVPRATDDWRDLVQDATIDAIAIAVPPPAQPGIALGAIAAGKHVFCEKPIAPDASQAAAMLAAANAAGVAHAVDFMFPELAAWQSARELLRQGVIGSLRHATLHWRVETYAHRTRSSSWKVRPGDGGGTVTNFVSHALHNVEWLIGPIHRLAARVASSGGVPDVLVDVWTDGPVPVTMSVAADAVHGTGHRIEIYGDAGAIVLANSSTSYTDGFTVSVARRDGTGWEPMPVPPSPETGDRLAGVAPIVSRFVSDIRSGKRSRPNLSDGLRVQRLIDAIREADGGGGWVSTEPSVADASPLSTPVPALQ